MHQSQKQAKKQTYNQQKTNQQISLCFPFTCIWSSWNGLKRVLLNIVPNSEVPDTVLGTAHVTSDLFTSDPSSFMSGGFIILIVPVRNWASEKWSDSLKKN